MSRSSKKITKKTTKKAAKKTRATTKKATKRASKKVTKKTTKKTTKKAAKKTTRRSNATRTLVGATGEQCFWVQDGQVLQDLKELQAALEQMRTDVFMYHVSGERNDFADWVEYVLSDTACARDLRRSGDQARAHQVVIRHLRYYA